MDFFLEEVVSRKNKGAEALLYALAIMMMGLCGAYVVFMFFPLVNEIMANGFSLPLALQSAVFLLMAAICVFLFLSKDRIRTEYEYTFTNGTMDFAKVFNNRKRRNLGTMNISNVEACGKVASGSFRRFISMPGVKRLNWFLNRDADLFFFYFVKNGVRTVMVIEPSGAMTSLIVKAAGQGKYQQN